MGTLATDQTAVSNGQELAEYYGTAVVPARVRKPQDKSRVEASVRFAETWIIAALRDRKFFSIREVNEAIAEKLEELNSRPFQRMVGTRRSAYLEEEKQYMLPLPAVPFDGCGSGFAVVRNQQPGHTAKILEGVDVAGQPVLCFHILAGFRIGVAAARKHGHKQICRAWLSGYRVIHRKGVPRPVHLDGVSRLVLDAHGGLCHPRPSPVLVSELRAVHGVFEPPRRR
mgnify:CR=1 FL=1